ncbi:DUF6544 family protein [Euzebya sp.]|uniref:DUF6544 family protein n=1 Tax=Euzebya sp. TaxID=1971409 RepID=UPI0035156800
MPTATLLRHRTTELTSAPPRRRPRRLLIGVVGGAVILLVAGWSGLQVQPSPLPPPAVAPGEVRMVPLPDGLPAPVDRFYRTVYGDGVPVVDSAVITGRGTIRIAGLTFPARFRFSHVSGRAYRHHIQLTAFGARLTAVDEWYVDGHARLELPFGVSEGPNVDQGANLALWAEAVWMPSVWVTDPRVRWEPVDDTSAVLRMPFGHVEETFTVRFDPDTGLLASMASQRFKGEDDTARTGWLNETPDWGHVDGYPVPLVATVTWADEDSPWAHLRTEQVIYGADLDDYVRVSGP